MKDRIVLSFWMSHAGLTPAAGRSYLERTRALVQRGETLGGNLIAFGAQLVAFAFDVESLEEAISLSTTAVLDETLADEVAWAAALAEGALEAVTPEEPRRWLSWGPPLAFATALARHARPGEVLVHRSLSTRHALVALGSRMAQDGGRRLRGKVLDPRQPWRHIAAAQVSRVQASHLIGREDPSVLLLVPGTAAVLRADPGLGGTRLLSELATLVAPAACVTIEPCGSGLEPMGALRRALLRVQGLAANLPPELALAFGRLLRGEGAQVEVAATILASVLRPTDGAPGALLIDDAREVDVSSLEAAARALALSNREFSCVLRVDETDAVPAVFAPAEPGPTLELLPFEGREGEELVEDALGEGALDESARKRWAHRGNQTPLGILEAIYLGVTRGELTWEDDAPVSRSRLHGRGKPHPAEHWIARRAQLLDSAFDQLILAVITLAGGELPVERLGKLLRVAKVQVDVAHEVKKLVALKWLVMPQPGWVALPTRTHRDAVAGELNDEALRGLIHRAIAVVLEQEERGLGLAEAAYHLAKAGETKRAAQLALKCARAALRLGLTSGVTHLVAFATENDPACEEDARSVLSGVVPSRSSRPPMAPVEPSGSGGSGTAYVASAEVVEWADRGEPISQTTGVLAPNGRPSQPPPGNGRAVGTSIVPPPSDTASAMASVVPSEIESVGERLTELAKEALLDADTPSLERWAEGLIASGEHGRFAERMQAIVRLARGDVGDAIRALRVARGELGPGSNGVERCQTALALGMALAVAGRPEEALLEALDALGCAKEVSDKKGTVACLAFLAKLYTTVDRTEEAGRLLQCAQTL